MSRLYVKMSVIESNTKLGNSSYEVQSKIDEDQEHVIYSRYLTEDDYDKIQPDLTTELFAKAYGIMIEKSSNKPQ